MGRSNSTNRYGNTTWNDDTSDKFGGNATAGVIGSRNSYLGAGCSEQGATAGNIIIQPNGYMFPKVVVGSMSDDTDEDVRASMTRGERVRAAARTLRTPRTASWVADETDVSVKTAQKYLDQLVADDVLRRVDRDDRTFYCVDRLMATYREIAALQRAHDREELTGALESMRTKITDWRTSYGVDTPGELRASIAELDDRDEIEARREAAGEWEHLDDRIPVVRAALNEYDWATERDTISV